MAFLLTVKEPGVVAGQPVAHPALHRPPLACPKGRHRALRRHGNMHPVARAECRLCISEREGVVAIAGQLYSRDAGVFVKRGSSM